MGDVAVRAPVPPEHRFVDPPPLPQPPEPHLKLYGRFVVAVVVAVVVGVGAFAAAVGTYAAESHVASELPWVSIWGYETRISWELAPPELLLIAAICIAGIAAVAVAFELIAALLSITPRRGALSARGMRAATAAGPVRITVLVPAHNEETSLPGTLSALARQTRPPDRVIVVADNCSDRTVTIAREMGFEAFETVGNTHRKGGALNQALAQLLPTTDGCDAVMVMDADTQLSPQFLQIAAQRLDDDPELTAVGGIFYGEDGHGLVGQFQRNEYTRYSLQLKARHGRVFVLTGTATVFRAEALLDVAAGRGVFLPGEPGRVYDTAALTEDNELTLALKTLGATMTSPAECMVTTEIMPTWRNLWVQRQRWQRGALENLSAYGLTSATLRYWGQQVGIGYGTFALNLFLALMAITLLALDSWIWFPFWMGVGAIFVAERVLTVWRSGWRARLLALTLLPELAYDVFLQAVFVKCLAAIALGRSTRWGHVHAPTGAPGP